MSTTPPLAVTGLRKAFGDTRALAGVDLELEPGELVAVVGPSGCGKSTLLRVVAGLVDADGGRVELGGRLVEDGRDRLPPEGRGVGLVFQEHALFPHLSVEDNVAFGLRESGRSERTARVGEMLELVGLPTHGRRFPHELSGGERQRVALARALAPRPAMMLFDEPFASIDHNLRVRLRADVVAVLETTGTPALVVTHDQAEALALGHRIAVMQAGRVVQIDRPATVFHHPVDRFVASFMGEAAFLRVEGQGAEARCAVGPLPDGGDPAVAMVRPDDLEFDADGDDGDRLVAAEYQGSGWLLTVDLAGGETVLVSGRALERPELGATGSVRLRPGRHAVPVADT